MLGPYITNDAGLQNAIQQLQEMQHQNEIKQHVEEIQNTNEVVANGPKIQRQIQEMHDQMIKIASKVNYDHHQDSPSPVAAENISKVSKTDDIAEINRIIFQDMQKNKNDPLFAYRPKYRDEASSNPHRNSI